MYSSMLASAFVLSLTALSALGRVTKMYAPSTATAGYTIEVTLESHPYIQNWDDFGVVWGLKNPSNGACTECVGSKIGYNDLSAEPWLGNKTFQVTIPDYQQGGDYTFVAAVSHLVGASGIVGFNFWNSTISITAAPSS